MRDEEYMQKFAKQYNELMKLPIWTDDLYCFMDRFFKLRDLEINERTKNESQDIL